MGTLLRDLRYGVRQLRRTPGFTVAAVLTLALGIGANTAIFSLVNFLILRPLPVEKPGQLVQFLLQGFGRTGSHFSYPDFVDLRDGNHVFSGVAGVFWLNESVLDARFNAQPENTSGQLVSGNFFSLLGVRPAAGRLITPEDDRTPGGAQVAVLSYNYWERRFAAGPPILGKSIVLHGASFTVVGIAPAGFKGIAPGFSPDVYVPFATEPVFHDGKSWLDKRPYHWVEILARLKPGVSIGQAQAELAVLFQQGLGTQVKPDWAPKDREEFLSQRLELTSASSGLSELRRDLSRSLFLLGAMVALVLLIACANVASMLMARGVMRRREIAVRLAIGAGRGRIVQQLLTESLLLGLGGGALGLLLATWMSNLLEWLISLGQGHVVIQLYPDLRVLGFTTLASLLTTALFGLVPAWRSTRVEVNPVLKEDPRGSSASVKRLRMGKALVVSQVGFCAVLLFGAGLFMRTLRNLKTLDPGFNRRDVLLFSIDPTRAGYKDDAVADLYRRLLDRLNATPGVRAASLSAITPIWGGGWDMEVWAEGYTARPGEDVVVDVNSVGPKFFSTLETPLLLGRDFSSEDTVRSPKVAIINRAMARYFFGSQNPIGKKFGWNEQGGAKKDFEIIGVAGDAKYLDMREQPPRTAYLDCFQDSLGGMSFEVRTGVTPATLVPDIRRAVEGLGQNVQLSNFKTLDDQVDESLGHERLVATLSGLFGALALLVASIGLYGLMAYAVAQRTNEIGIRMALGAESFQVLWMVLRETLLLALIGVAIGLPVALAATRLVSSMLYGLQPADPVTAALAALVMAAVAVFAGYLPARRASRVDPMVALRCE